ncbi:hypothetical protein N657DRAFT_407189 [Parathielavia appendiculata]|uniref:BTB domain-containing protein n=1 Tax=Parathielavia appendiculata TaxID=2587402 RepID=A0AAN6TPC4_9PEZI|nr:hypothetical protein N657DRAFT_407189 [Parathielavia appendiculata]
MNISCSNRKFKAHRAVVYTQSSFLIKLLQADSSCDTLNSFPAVVDELCTWTPDTDVALCKDVCRLAGLRIKEDELRERTDWVLKKHGDFVVGVMNAMIESDRRILAGPF